MTVTEVLKLLEENKNERGIANWDKTNNTLNSYGIGLTQLRKLAKQIGRDRKLALELWESDYYDAKIVSLLIDDPKLMTRDQVEKQVGQLAGGYLEHVFSSCNATLAKTSFTKELADEWMVHEDPVRRRCGYGLLYEMSKSKKKSAPDNEYFLEQIQRIRETVKDESIPTQMSMAAALMGMGLRHIDLNRAALKVAKYLGPIDFDERGKCDPFDVVKHLEGDNAKKKFGLI